MLKLAKYFLKLFLISFIGFTVCWVILYRFINPPVTWLMLQRAVERKVDGKTWKIDKEWKDFEDISLHFKKAVIAAEDQKFLNHYGFDFKAIEKAIDKNKSGAQLRGGSTISQQTAKNVFLWAGRSWLRKGFETYFTILIEIFWSKQRILEVYLNVIEMGDGIYGIQAASSNFFNTDAGKLTQRQAALIAAVLPNPRRWSPARPTAYINKRQQQIIRNMRRLGPLSF